MQDLAGPFNLYNPSFLIKYENLENDIKKLPFIDFNDSKVLNSFNGSVLKNFYLNEGLEKPAGSLTRSKEDTRYALWQTYYNANLANIIYEKFALEFEMFKYDKNSWKI